MCRGGVEDWVELGCGWLVAGCASESCTWAPGQGRGRADGGGVTGRDLLLDRNHWRRYSHSSQPTTSQLPLVEEVHCGASGRMLNCSCHENSRLHMRIALLCEHGCRNRMRRSTTPKFRPSRFRRPSKSTYQYLMPVVTVPGVFF